MGQDILDRITAHGLCLSLSGDNIEVTGNREALTPERRDYIKAHKPEIIALLKKREHSLFVAQALGVFPGGKIIQDTRSNAIPPKELDRRFQAFLNLLSKSYHTEEQRIGNAIECLTAIIDNRSDGITFEMREGAVYGMKRLIGG